MQEHLFHFYFIKVYVHFMAIALNTLQQYRGIVLI